MTKRVNARDERTKSGSGVCDLSELEWRVIAFMSLLLSPESTLPLSSQAFNLISFLNQSQNV